MKLNNKSFTNKLLWIVNSLVAICLLIGFVSYYLPPTRFSFGVYFGLLVPVFLVVNALFLTYWVVKWKKKSLLSLLILLMYFPSLNKFIGVSKKITDTHASINIMSYNVRMFNHYKWIKKDSIEHKIFNFIKEENPAILCFQEYYPSEMFENRYPYKYVKMSEENSLFGYAIFSKYKIIKANSLRFSNTGNDVIYADLVIDNDTVRVYDVHLESLRISSQKTEKNIESKSELEKRLSNSFKKQESQARLLKKHLDNSPYPSILVGDFNNNAFSWVYKILKEHRKDAFEIAGIGFGKTYKYIFPMRIDFILADSSIKINNYNTYNVHYSDHFPIMAQVSTTIENDHSD